jgi:2-isopropylmalate synthase
MPNARITIFDTTLRDGEQSPGCSMNLPEKLRLAKQLERLGVDVIEAGFPIASDGDFEAVKAVAREIRTPVVAALARAIRADVERAWAAVREAARPRLHVFLATSDIHLESKLKMTREQCLRQTAETVAHAKSFCPDVEFSAEDAMRTTKEFLGAIVETAAAAGATTINLPDTVGYCLPQEIAAMFTAMRAKLAGRDDVALSTHCHDDLGLAVANSIASLTGGARQVECTINGIGERAGNASLEELVMALQVRRDALPFTTEVHAEQLYPTSCMLTEITGVAVQPNKAIVGRNAFAHEAGIHQDGMIKNPLTYEIMSPQSVGVPEGRLVLGKHSGRHALRVRCESLGYTFDRRQLDRLYRRFVSLADKIKVIEDEHFTALLQEEFSDAPRAAAQAATRENAAPVAMSKSAE